MNTVPEIRIRKANEAPLCASGEYVLYWMPDYLALASAG